MLIRNRKASGFNEILAVPEHQPQIVGRRIDGGGYGELLEA